MNCQTCDQTMDRLTELGEWPVIWHCPRCGTVVCHLDDDDDEMFQLVMTWTVPEIVQRAREACEDVEAVHRRWDLPDKTRVAVRKLRECCGPERKEVTDAGEAS